MTTLFTREDTMLGVCQGLGEELGIPALLPRLAFALALFWNPAAVIATYLSLGVALALFRWAFPPHRAAPAPVEAAAPRGDNDDAEPLAIAA